MSILFRFACAMHRARKAKGLTQEKVAEALGISLRWYQSIEEGRGTPGTILTLKIIAFLEIDGKDLQAKESVSLHNI